MMNTQTIITLLQSKFDLSLKKGCTICLSTRDTLPSFESLVKNKTRAILNLFKINNKLAQELYVVLKNENLEIKIFAPEEDIIINEKTERKNLFLESLIKNNLIIPNENPTKLLKNNKNFYEIRIKRENLFIVLKHLFIKEGYIHQKIYHYNDPYITGENN